MARLLIRFEGPDGTYPIYVDPTRIDAVLDHGPDMRTCGLLISGMVFTVFQGLEEMLALVETVT